MVHENQEIPEDFMAAEFEYMAQTAFQAHEDRARVTTFYLLSVASFVAAIVGAQFENLNADVVGRAFIALFLVLSAMGLLTLLQLVRLRQAWFESIEAMNHMKSYVISQFPGLSLEKAFLWQKGTMPRKFKRWSVAYLLALQVSVLGGATLAAAVYFVGQVSGRSLWMLALIVGFVFVLLQMLLHRWLLSR